MEPFPNVKSLLLQYFSFDKCKLSCSPECMSTHEWIGLLAATRRDRVCGSQRSDRTGDSSGQDTDRTDRIWEWQSGWKLESKLSVTTTATVPTLWRHRCTCGHWECQARKFWQSRWRAARNIANLRSSEQTPKYRHMPMCRVRDRWIGNHKFTDVDAYRCFGPQMFTDANCYRWSRLTDTCDIYGQNIYMLCETLVKWHVDRRQCIDTSHKIASLSPKSKT